MAANYLINWVILIRFTRIFPNFNSTKTLNRGVKPSGQYELSQMINLFNYYSKYFYLV